MIQIPVTNQPNQSFRVTIPLDTGNIVLEFFIYWNNIANYWQMDITDSLTDEKVVVGQPLIVGQAPTQNCLRQLTYTGIGAATVVPLSDDVGDAPGVDDWGTNFILVWS